MKKLTINQVARANIRVNRKAYVSLFAGILLAVFLVTATGLCAWGTVRGHDEQMAQRVGWMDMFMLGSERPTDDQLRSCGFFQRIGHVTVDAGVKDTSIYSGYYDEEAEKLINRTLTEGRFPEKNGEVAAEMSALIQLGQEKAKIGDTLTLNMKPIYGNEEEKTFTLVGILNEQSEYLNRVVFSEEEGMRLPSLMVFPGEHYGMGTVMVHRVLTYAPLITFNQVMRNCPLRYELRDCSFGVSRETGEAVFDDSGWRRARDFVSRIALWVVLGAALMLSACIGIATAMESLLSRKTEDIGMLRAIGSTRRQIRRIYGAEAWMLTATALPAGLILGILTAWVISRLAPDQVAFDLNIWLLIPILGVSGLCVFAASRLPLYHASAQTPMGVLRDTGMLRRAGKIRNHTEFKPDRLIAGRRVRLHPLRQAGTAGMIALTLLSTLLLGEVVLGIKNQDGERPAFSMYSFGNAYSEDSFSQCESEEEDVRSELRRLADYGGISRVQSATSIRGNLLMEELPEYFRPLTLKDKDAEGNTLIQNFSPLGAFGTSSEWLFYSEGELADARSRIYENWDAAEMVKRADQMNLIRDQLGITDKVVPVNVMVADPDAELLKENVTDGTIDLEKLDSGEQVLVYAPELCVRKQENGGYNIETWLLPGEIREKEWDIVIRNDYFKKGMNLSLLEMTGNRVDDIPMDTIEIGEEWKNWYQSMTPVRNEVKVGAVLSGGMHINGTYMSGVTVIVTEKGARAMGLKLPNPDTTQVFCTSDPTPEEEELVKNRIQSIAARGGMSYENELEIIRARRAKKLREILILTGMILLFFAVSVFMQVTGVARQIRSDTRMIGTLRAVGADLRTLVGCYRLPVWICAGVAMIPCLLFYAVSGIPALRLFTASHPLIMIPILAVLAVCVALACTAGIRGRLTGVARQPIVENIREL